MPYMNMIQKMQQYYRMPHWFSENKIIFLVFLLIQNVSIFWAHYFNNAGFPWDFVASYYAWPAFWTTSISMGIFPQWIPYQAMGYPLAINSQSGLFYPIFWIFPILHIPYTLHAAVIVQAFHVLLGSIGMFMLLNLIFKSSRYAFIGAVAFQFFGGFYSNAEHADIVRAFAIAPWLFYVFKINSERPSITKRILFIPIIIYFLTTGAYPGNIISSLFIIPVFLSLEIFHAYRKVKRTALKVGALMFGLMVLGISIAVVHLGPIWQERNELTRFTGQFSSLAHVELSIDDVPGLFMSSRALPGEPSMLSTFVTLPMLIFASFTPLSAVKKHWVFLVVLILSVLMVAGPNSPFWQAITSAVPALKLSRFPSSDYRVFVAIPLIMLGTAGLRAIMERKLSWKEIAERVAFVITWFLFGVYLLIHVNPAYFNKLLVAYNIQTPLNLFVVYGSQLFLNFQVMAASFIAFITILVVTYYLRKDKMPMVGSSVNKSITLSSSALIIIVILISSDGFRVLSDMPTWNMTPFDKSYTMYNIPLEKNGKLITYSIFENIPNERPARDYTQPGCPQGCSPWIGYLLGKYLTGDDSGTVLEARSVIQSNNVFSHYMLMKWTPILVDPSLAKTNDFSKIILPINTFSNITGSTQQKNSSSQVIQTRYGINDISYKIALKEPKLMVENEIYFPGWQADLIFQHKEANLKALVANNAFRAWLLPAGDYIMIAHFHYPNLIYYQSLALIFFGAWIFIIVRYWRKLDDDHKQLLKEKNL